MTFLRTLGKFLISVGVGVLLFVVWTLNGTGLYTASQQRSLQAEFDKLPPLAAGVTPRKGEPTGPPSSYRPSAGDPVFRIKIPEIDFNKIVVEGVDVEDLRKGPGHYPACRDGFVPPLCTKFGEVWPGEEGRVIVSGHRTTYGAPFGDLDELEAGDRIDVETKWGDFTYVVTKKEIVKPDTRAIVADVEGIRELVLTTCNPKFSAAQRLIIFAELQDVA